MNVNDHVRYNERHYEWLVAAARWPRKVTREELVGTVCAPENDGLVSVMWGNGRFAKVHFTDNLELV